MFLLFWAVSLAVLFFGNKDIRGLVISLFKVLVLVLLLNTFFFQVFVIPSGSMLPGLEIGDRLFVSKYPYGYNKNSIPYGTFLSDIFYLEKIFNFWDYRLFYSEPKRGDIIVFKPDNGDTYFVKRLIGLPGDKVQMINQELFINGKKVTRYKINGNLFLEINPENKKYIIRDIGYSLKDDTEEFLVPEDYFFFMGDNRDNSLDSRSSMGMIKKSELVGRVERYFLSSNLSFLDNPIGWIKNLSFAKFMKRVN